MEGGPVYSPLVSLENVLDQRVIAAEELVVHPSDHIALLDLLGDSPYCLLPEPSGIPHSNRLVERGRDDEVLLRVESRTHDVVVVTREHRDAAAGLPVPDADGLVVRGGHDPGVLRMELHGADVVEVAEESKQTAAELVVPDLDLVVVSAGYD